MCWSGMCMIVFFMWISVPMFFFFVLISWRIMPVVIFWFFFMMFFCTVIISMGIVVFFCTVIFRMFFCFMCISWCIMSMIIVFRSLLFCGRMMIILCMMCLFGMMFFFFSFFGMVIIFFMVCCFMGFCFFFSSFFSFVSFFCRFLPIGDFPMYTLEVSSGTIPFTRSPLRFDMSHTIHDRCYETICGFKCLGKRLYLFDFPQSEYSRDSRKSSIEYFCNWSSCEVKSGTDRFFDKYITDTTYHIFPETIHCIGSICECIFSCLKSTFSRTQKVCTESNPRSSVTFGAWGMCVSS